jgi:hypothetical protein
MRDQIVDFVRRWSEKTEIGVGRFVGFPAISGWRIGRSRPSSAFHLKKPPEACRRLRWKNERANLR